MNIADIQVSLLTALGIAAGFWKVYHKVSTDLSAMAGKMNSLAEINKIQDQRTQKDFEVLDKAQALVEKEWNHKLELIQLKYDGELKTAFREVTALTSKLRKLQQYVIENAPENNQLQLDTMTDLGLCDSHDVFFDNGDYDRN